MPDHSTNTLLPHPSDRGAALPLKQEGPALPQRGTPNLLPLRRIMGSDGERGDSLCDVGRGSGANESVAIELLLGVRRKLTSWQCEVWTMLVGARGGSTKSIPSLLK